MQYYVCETYRVITPKKQDDDEPGCLSMIIGCIIIVLVLRAFAG